MIENAKLKTVEPPILAGESSLVRIKLAAIKNPDMAFTSIAHRIDLHLLKRSYKEKSTGVDKISAKEYSENLDRNLFDLYTRLIYGKYKACPVKRIWIDKEGGKKRPIGIPALEDKIVQKAVAILMTMIFDENFYDFSYGFRTGFNQHMAIHQIRESCWAKSFS